MLFAELIDLSQYNLTLASLSCLHCGKALAAVNRSVAGGLERNLGLAAASRAGRHKHFSCSFARVLAIVTAGFASLRLILESLLSIELLLAGSENKLLTAIFALQCDVLVHAFLLALKNGKFLPRTDSNRHLCNKYNALS